jgi:hypothetical protein
MVFSLKIQAQQGFVDVIYLKNGSIIKGKIIEQIPNKSFKIQLDEGKILEFNTNEIANVKKETPGSSIYNSNKINELPRYFGLQAGVNLSNFAWYNNGPNKKFGTRLQVAVVYNKKLENGLEFQPELQYSQQGVNGEATYSTSSGSPYSINEELISEYINIPLLLKYNFSIGNHSIYLSAGPYLGYWINYTYEQNLTVNGITTSTKYFVHEQDWSNFNRLQTGASIGWGVSQTLSNKGKIYFDNRVSYGFTKLFKNYTKDDAPHDIYIGLSLGYMFLLK